MARNTKVGNHAPLASLAALELIGKSSHDVGMILGRALVAESPTEALNAYARVMHARPNNEVDQGIELGFIEGVRFAVAGRALAG